MHLSIFSTGNRLAHEEFNSTNVKNSDTRISTKETSLDTTIIRAWPLIIVNTSSTGDVHYS